MASLTNAATILLVTDVEHSCNWYRDKLGFTIVELYGMPVHTAFIQRDGFYIMFIRAADSALIKPNWKISDKTSNIYFWVNDIETLYKEFIAAGANIDYELYPTPWGVKEFGINDPDEYDIAFGEIIK
jgi:catechol 2,3-dioxygenase-like lactoylglutathione lyase family enzyme